jgi:hypothetical protein
MKVNTTGCAPGWATDQFLLVESVPLSCNAPLAGFISLSVFIFSMKIFVAIHHSMTWRRRYLKEKNSSARTKRYQGRLPIVPTLTWLFVLSYALLFTLSGLNIINAQNGGAPALIGICWTIMAISALLFLRKFVSLGYRIAPRPKGAAFSSVAGMENLSKFDTKGKISLALCVSAVIVQFVLFCIMPFFYNADDRFIRAAVGVEGYFIIQNAISIANHVNRVKNM